MLWRPLLCGFYCLAACSVFPDETPIVEVAGRDGSAGSSSTSGGESPGSGGESGSGGSGGSAGDASTGNRRDGSMAGAGGFGGLQGDSGLDGAGLQAGTGGGDAASDGGPSSVVYPATIADCLEEMELDPNACRSFAESQSGPNQLWVDVRSPPRREFRGFLKFDIDSTLIGAEVTGVHLELTVTSTLDAASAAPVVWEVQEFQSRAELFVAEPMPVGDAPLAVAPETTEGETLRYALPADTIGPKQSVHLGLLPSTGPTALYNANGRVPPRLVVEYR